MTTLHVNGWDITLDIDPEIPLLWALRDALHLTGTKFGCGVAQCDAGTVIIDGEPQRACQSPISAAEGGKITAIEGLDRPVVAAVQDAWSAIDLPQCGWCQSGQIMSANARLTGNKAPSDADIDAAMTGNVCRCATYVRIRQAIHNAAKTPEG